MEQKLSRKLGFGAAYGAAVGLVVSGSGMFAVGNVGGTVGYSTFIVALIALIPIMITALSFSELTAMLPGGGMISDYTIPALGRFWGAFSLLSGYVMLVMADGGTQLTMGGEAIGNLFGLNPWIFTIIIFALVQLVNIFDVGIYGKVEMYLTLFMMLVFALLAFSGFFHVGESLVGAVPVNDGMAIIPEGGFATIMSCMGTGIWFYVGFEFTCPMAEENKKPYRNIPLALILGTLTITVVNSVFSAASVRYTELEVLASSALPHVEAAGNMMGTPGYIMMATLTTLASFTTANSYTAGLPRMLYGLSREGLLPKWFGEINPKTRTPVHGILFVGGLMICTIAFLVVNGAASDSITFLINVACISWMSAYIIAMIDVLVYRKRYPDYPRYFKMPAPHILVPIGIAGIAYAIYSMRAYILPSLIYMTLVVLYCFVWCKKKGFDLFTPKPLEEQAQAIIDRTEYLEGWNEEVTAWIAKQKQKVGTT
ncbi:amino acid/polyamine/organocation transporter, APC superfamily [Oscillibacter sp. PC13]|uniref:APC family permease n=1 Tax=Oscillibacter sp. PC13 TaxID=1855299 RepID=UPI0008EF02F5|nr:APC family permease [Oscillibacter sp. PC13]SFQ15941.1 amino acid/polyamine/organocation transporter, APC superfamily [Oscillibacter sp. PC13]